MKTLYDLSVENMPNIIERLEKGEAVILSDVDCDLILANFSDIAARLRTEFNPNRIGLLDKYIGTLSD